MKVAATISGLPRFSKEFDVFLNSLQEYEQIDWFFYLWNLDEKIVPAPRFAEIDWTAPCWKTMNADQMREKIVNNLPENHKVVFLELHEIPPYNPIREPIPNPWTYTKGVYFNHLGQKLVTEARENYEKENGKYDLVIKARPDCGIYPSINLYAANDFLNHNTNAILTPADHRLGVQGRIVSEAIAFGSSDNISVFSKMFDYMYNYELQGVIFHPETLTAHHLYVNGIVTPMTNFNFLLRHFKTPSGGPDWGRWD